MHSDTIVALASGSNRAGIAVIRLSGPQAGNILLAVGGGRELPPPRLAVYRRFKDPHNGVSLDDGLILWFPAPASFTGEDVVEFHCHGGRAVIEGILKALCACSGVRPAEPGEFSRRAFENGKLDLTQVEAIADLIDAQTEAQKRQALRQMDGSLARQLGQWRENLLHALAYLEAYIDFPEESIPETLESQVRSTVNTLAGQLRIFLDDGHRGERLREGIHVTLLGSPNVGKSSLLNALSRREAAIVTAQAGTTRDVIEVNLDLGGYPVVLADTAGLRETEEEIEAEGVRRALARAEQTDIRLVVLDGAVWPSVESYSMSLVNERTLLVVNKADLLLPSEDLPGLPVSTKTGQGLEDLITRLTVLVRKQFDEETPALVTRQRHRTALEDCQDSLKRALAASDTELMAEDLRMASRALGRITGQIVVDDILDKIFHDFCIGK